MKKTLMIVGLIASLSLVTHGDEGEVQLLTNGAELQVRILGSTDDDWHVEFSPDLFTWDRVAGFGTLLSGDEQAPVRSVGNPSAPAAFFRAVKSDGLYDDTLIRTFRLTFKESNWPSLLTTARTTGTNVECSLTLDNGAEVSGAGARYKGNSSFQMGGTKKSVNLQVNHTNATTELMGYETINLNNAAGDNTLLREPIYFNVMHRYAPSPRGALARLIINDVYWGLYSLAQQEDGDLIQEWFSSNDGDRWRTPNAGGGTGGPGGGGPGGPGGNPFASPTSALSWYGTNIAAYSTYYELKKAADTTNAWVRLVHAIDVLNNTAEAERRDAVEDVLAVDSWLWFLAVENIFADDDSYWNKGADYGFYFEPESGRIHPVEHDGNEAFLVRDVSLSPVAGTTGTNRPVLSKLLILPELRQRYLAHMRTVLEEAFHPDVMTPLIDRLSTQSIPDLAADTKKGFTMATYTNSLRELKTFVTNRHSFLTGHAELLPVPPVIVSVGSLTVPEAGQEVPITAEVRAHGDEGLDSVWLWYRAGPTGKFSRIEMRDDGAHQDGGAGDGVFGAAAPGFLAGVKVRYYVEARSGNAEKASVFSPRHAEHNPLSYRVVPSESSESSVVINELMADNADTLRDPQGERDDWIELRNLSNAEVDLAGWYLSDNPENPRKWPFPAGTRIAAGGYLLIWADEDGGDSPGLHANFKLSASGEQLLLLDTDARLNALRDSVSFGPVGPDIALGRTTAQSEELSPVPPTPGAANP